MIALLLMQKILAMFLMMLVGFVLVRLKTFRPEESLVLSRIVVLLVMPCVAIKAFQIDYTESVRNGLLLALLASLIVFGILLFQAPFLAHALPNSKQVLLVVLLCCAAPTASVITQMAQVYGGDSAYANLLNVATTILCIVTIPLSVALYLAL